MGRTANISVSPYAWIYTGSQINDVFSLPCREKFCGRLHLIRQKERQEERKEDDWPQSGVSHAGLAVTFASINMFVNS